MDSDLTYLYYHLGVLPRDTFYKIAAVLLSLHSAEGNPPLKGLAGVNSTQSVLYFVETFLHAMIFGS